MSQFKFSNVYKSTVHPSKIAALISVGNGRTKNKTSGVKPCNKPDKQSLYLVQQDINVYSTSLSLFPVSPLALPLCSINLSSQPAPCVTSHHQAFAARKTSPFATIWPAIFYFRHSLQDTYNISPHSSGTFLLSDSVSNSSQMHDRGNDSIGKVCAPPCAAAL